MRQPLKLFKMKQAAGFTLIEMAIVLFIVALLLGGLLTPLSSQVEQRKLSETQKSLDEIKEALIGFAIVNKRLPRPAVSSSDGTEGAACGTEAACTGFIPWATLGVHKLDSYGKIFRYSVTPAFANGAIAFTAVGTKTIQTRNSTGTLVTLLSAIPAATVSQGKNNWGTADNGNAFANTSTTNTDEGTNNTANVTFISRTQSGNSATSGGEFDDIVTGLSANILFSRMTAAGVLP